MPPRKTLVLVTLALLAGGATAGRAQRAHDAAGPAPTRAAALRAAALEQSCNLDYPEALATLQRAIDLDPDDPATYRIAAAVMWIKTLVEAGSIMVDDYLGQARSTVARQPPPPEADAFFRDKINRAIALSEARVRANPKDADARYQLGAASGFLASYMATVEGRVVGSLGTAQRAYDEHERVLALDANRKDAGLVVGSYRYGVSTLSVPMRLIAHIVGFGGGRERGLSLVEGASTHPGDAQVYALFTLIVMYNREDRFDDALRVTRELQQRFPRNRLLWLEAGSTALRAGRAADARRSLELGLAMLAADRRPRGFGEEARWRLAYGSALVLQHDRAAADRELRAALAGTAPGWVHGRAHKELGKLADLAGDRPRAIEAYRRAESLCRAGSDKICTDEARRLVKTAYR